MENKLGDPSCLLCERVAGGGGRGGGLAWRKKGGKPRTGAEEILAGGREGGRNEGGERLETGVELY